MINSFLEQEVTNLRKGKYKKKYERGAWSDGLWLRGWREAEEGRHIQLHRLWTVHLQRVSCHKIILNDSTHVNDAIAASGILN